MQAEQGGHKLMTAMGNHASMHGYVSMWWSGLQRNEGALRFYGRLGARNSGALQYEIDGDALTRLAG